MSHEDDLQQRLAQVVPTSVKDEQAAWQRLNSLTKPPGSLGRLEELAVQIARIQGVIRPDVDYRAIIIAAGDHGVVEEGVSSYPQDVTWQMMLNFINGGAAINQIAAVADAELWLVDVGVARDLSPYDQIRHKKVAWATANMAKGPAMSREQCAQAVLVGLSLADEACADGVRMVGIGEMGIGNTTAASALTAAYADSAVESVVGTGTGLDQYGVLNKREVVTAALRINRTHTMDPLGVLSAVGGLEIACLSGIAIGCAIHKAVVVCDGFISTAAALAAVRMAPPVNDYLVASHRSSEPGHGILLDVLGLNPILDLEMRLGEGTGAAAAFPLIDASCRMISGMATFSEAGVAEKDDSK